MDSIQSGKRIIKWIIAMLILTNAVVVAVTIAAYLSVEGSSFPTTELWQSIAGLVLACLLSYSLYRGFAWAKWATVAVLLLSVLNSIILLFTAGFSLHILISGAIYLVISLILLLCKDVEAFLGSRREAVSSDSVDRSA